MVNEKEDSIKTVVERGEYLTQHVALMSGLPQLAGFFKIFRAADPKYLWTGR